MPIALMKAIATVESGQNVNGELMPWPWTINFQGRGIWLGDRDEARNRIEVLTRLGSRNIDVGCFQLNLKWHGQNFSSVEAMLEPANNARYAAWFLRRLYMEFGSWEGAAKAFHSRTPRLSERYRYKLAPVLARFGGRFDNVAASTERVTFREHSTPDVEDGQVQSARPRAIASLVPYDFHGGAGPLVGLGK